MDLMLVYVRDNRDVNGGCCHHRGFGQMGKEPPTVLLW